MVVLFSATNSSFLLEVNMKVKEVVYEELKIVVKTWLDGCAEGLYHEDKKVIELKKQDPDLMLWVLAHELAHHFNLKTNLTDVVLQGNGDVHEENAAELYALYLFSGLRGLSTTRIFKHHADKIGIKAVYDLVDNFVSEQHLVSFCALERYVLQIAKLLNIGYDNGENIPWY